MLTRISSDARRTAQHTLLYALERQDALDGALVDALGEYSWDLDLAQHLIRFSGEGGELEGRAVLLASVAAKPATLLWGWSPQLAGVVGEGPAALRLRAAAGPARGAAAGADRGRHGPGTGGGRQRAGRPDSGRPDSGRPDLGHSDPGPGALGRRSPGEDQATPRRQTG